MGSAPPVENAGQQLDASLPESRVLIIGTGGTICMQHGPDGLQPSQGFMDDAMAPRPSFNDMSSPKGELRLFPTMYYDTCLHIPQVSREDMGRRASFITREHARVP